MTCRPALFLVTLSLSLVTPSDGTDPGTRAVVAEPLGGG